MDAAVHCREPGGEWRGSQLPAEPVLQRRPKPTERRLQSLGCAGTHPAPRPWAHSSTASRRSLTPPPSSRTPGPTLVSQLGKLRRRRRPERAAAGAGADLPAGGATRPPCSFLGARQGRRRGWGLPGQRRRRDSGGGPERQDPQPEPEKGENPPSWPRGPLPVATFAGGARDPNADLRRRGPLYMSDSCDPMDCSPPGSSVHGILQARRLESESESRSVVSDSLRPHGLCSPWNSPGQNTGMGSLSLLQGIFPTQGSNRGLPHCGQFFTS